MDPTYRNADKHLVEVNCVLLGFDGEALNVLLLAHEQGWKKRKWKVLHGGMNVDESVDEAARRILLPFTGDENINLEQLPSYSSLRTRGNEKAIAVACFAFAKFPLAQQNSVDQQSGWYPIHYLPLMDKEDSKVISQAIESVKERVVTSLIAFQLLPEKFLLSQLRNLIESILGHSLDKRNFQRKLIELGILIQLDEKGFHYSNIGKPASYFRLDKRRLNSFKDATTTIFYASKQKFK